MIGNVCVVGLVHHKGQNEAATSFVSRAYPKRVIHSATFRLAVKWRWALQGAFAAVGACSTRARMRLGRAKVADGFAKGVRGVVYGFCRFHKHG